MVFIGVSPGRKCPFVDDDSSGRIEVGERAQNIWRDLYFGDLADATQIRTKPGAAGSSRCRVVVFEFHTLPAHLVLNTGDQRFEARVIAEI
jgi:hypothetical protein